MESLKGDGYYREKPEEDDSERLEMIEEPNISGIQEGDRSRRTFTDIPIRIAVCETGDFLPEYSHSNFPPVIFPEIPPVIPPGDLYGSA